MSLGWPSRRAMETRRKRGGPRGALERGAALVIALLVMAMLLLLGTTFLTISSTETDIARNARESTQVFYVAATGVARLKRDLVAQFALPYQNLCPNLTAYADLTRQTLTTGEPLDLPIRRIIPGRRGWDLNGSVTCAKPGSTEYYLIWDANNQPVSPVGLTWRTVPYVLDGSGVLYQVEVRNATTPTDPSCPSCIEARVTATTATGTGASRQLQARFQVDRFSPAGHALWVDGGVWRWGAQANMTFAGPVFIKGWSTTYPAMRLGDGGATDTIANYYKNLDATLQAAIPAPPTKPNPVTGESEATLDTTLRVYQGPVEIRSSSASAGERTVAGNGLKETLNGVYTNQGFTQSPGAANVYSDNVAGTRFDLPRELIEFPNLSGPYTGPPLPGGTPPATHDAYLRGGALGIDGSLTIDSTTASFSYPPGLTDLSQCTGNCLIYRQGQDTSTSTATNPDGTPAAIPPTLMVNGTVWVKGDLALGGYGPNRLAAVRYKGTGSLYSRTGGDCCWGSIEVTADVLPPSGFPATSENPAAGGQFPTDHRLGLISGGWTGIGDWTTYGDPMAPTLRIAASIYANYGMYNYAPYQVAGSVMSRYFYALQSARIYYVPALAGARPPGMPGVIPPKAGTPYFVRTLYWRDVMP